MKKTFLCACIASIPLIASGQAGGVSINIENQNPLSKWGRWTSTENSSLNYGFKLNPERNKASVHTQWSAANWIFKLSRDEGTKRPDLFFGLKVSENQLQTTSLGCMSDNGGTSSRHSSTLCGIQLDMNLP